jgi:hypothetical protein
MEILRNTTESLENTKNSWLPNDVIEKRRTISGIKEVAAKRTSHFAGSGRNNSVTRH